MLLDFRINYGLLHSEFFAVIKMYVEKKIQREDHEILLRKQKSRYQFSLWIMNLFFKVFLHLCLGKKTSQSINSSHLQIVNYRYIFVVVVVVLLAVFSKCFTVNKHLL